MEETRFIIRDPDEVYWMFWWDKVGDITGWFLWRKLPGEEKFFCKGLLPEEDVFLRVSCNPPKLEEDDKIDLMLWLQGWDKGIYNAAQAEDYINSITQDDQAQEGAQAKG